MIEILLNISLIISILFILPAFVLMMMVIRVYKIYQIRYAKYFKFLLFLVFVHSIYLVAILFNSEFLNPFLAISLLMMPIYLLLLLHRFYIKGQIAGQRKILKEIAVENAQSRKLSNPVYKQGKPKLVARSTYKWR